MGDVDGEMCARLNPAALWVEALIALSKAGGFVIRGGENVAPKRAPCKDRVVVDGVFVDVVSDFGQALTALVLPFASRLRRRPLVVVDD